MSLARPWLLACALVALCGPGAWASAPADDLMALVPARAVGVTSVNVAALERHSAYKALRTRVSRAAVLRPVFTDPSHPLGRQGTVVRALSFHLDDDRQGVLLRFAEGRWDEAAARAMARSAMGTAYGEGVEGGGSWFTLDRGAVVLTLADGRAVVAALPLAQEVARTPQGTAAARDAAQWRSFAEGVRGGAPLLWSVGVGGAMFQPDVASRGAEAIAAVKALTVRVMGGQGVEVALVAHTADAAASARLVAWLRGEVERAMGARISYKVLGVAAILRRALPQPQGDRVVSTLALTEAQTRLIIRMAPDLVTDFRRSPAAP